MIEEFLEYTEAFKLRELGFDLPCIGWWFNYNNEPHFHLLDDVNGENNNFNLDLSKSDAVNAKETEQDYKSSCSGPTIRQVFKWFRDKHKLFGVIDKKEGIIFFKIQDINEELIAIAAPPFKTHEEAELACIRNLITLITKTT